MHSRHSIYRYLKYEFCVSQDSVGKKTIQVRRKAFTLFYSEVIRDTVQNQRSSTEDITKHLAQFLWGHGVGIRTKQVI